MLIFRDTRLRASLRTTWAVLQDMPEGGARARTWRLLAASLEMPRTCGDLVVPQLLEVPQGQDFAVERVHLVEGGPQPVLQFVADRGLARRGQLADELPGHRLRRRPGLRQATSWPTSRICGRGGSAGPSASAGRRGTQPDVERHGRVGEVLADAPGHVEKRLLKHVVGRRCGSPGGGRGGRAASARAARGGA